MGQNLQVFFIMAFVIIILTLTQAYTPYLTRKTQCFGISIPENQFDNPEFVKYRKSYKNQNIIIGAISLVVLLVSTFLNDYFVFVYIAVVFLDIIVSFSIFFHFNKKVREFKNKSDWKDQTTSVVVATITSENKNFISKGWLLIYPAIIIISAAFGFYAFDSLPGRIATKYDFSGNATHYVNKSIEVMLFTPLLQIFIAALFLFIFFVVKNSRRQIDIQNKEESERKVDIFRKTWGYFTIFGGAAMLLMMMIMQLSIYNIIPLGLALTLFFILLIAILVSVTIISIKVGQGGSRLSSKGERGKTISVNDDDKYWKLGSFYVNKDDPALFVEKRFGIGWTLNFGRPMSFVLMGVLVVFIILMTVFSARMG